MQGFRLGGMGERRDVQGACESGSFACLVLHDFLGMLLGLGHERFWHRTYRQPGTCSVRERNVSSSHACKFARNATKTRKVLICRQSDDWDKGVVFIDVF